MTESKDMRLTHVRNCIGVVAAFCFSWLDMTKKKKRIAEEIYMYCKALNYVPASPENASYCKLENLPRGMEWTCLTC